MYSTHLMVIVPMPMFDPAFAIMHCQTYTVQAENNIGRFCLVNPVPEQFRNTLILLSQRYRVYRSGSAWV